MHVSQTSPTEPIFTEAPSNGVAASIPNDTALVLLVDDQPIVGEAVRRLVSGEPDIDLHYCSNAGEAIATANRIRPTVILQDLVMPEVDGLDLVRGFRENASTLVTPIIVLSTKEDPHIKSQAFAVGANDYIVKLPDRAELIARLRYHSRAYLGQLQRDEAFRALRESQQRLLESNTALVALNQQLNEFVGMAAHDLRNPLGVVLGFAKFLLSDRQVPEEQKRKFLGTIQSSTEFMLRLVNDLLDISHIESGKLTLRPKLCDLGTVVEANVALNRIIASQKDIQVVVSIDPLTPQVWIDAHQVEQVLNNLLTNAIKYSYPNTTIEVKLFREGDEVILAVRDHGQGIPVSELNKLFTPFGVTSVKATKGEKSTGLGLLIAKKVVEAHRGRIWVESQPIEGSTFSIALPIEPSERQEADSMRLSTPS
jgi:signal transduction histidine kinase